MIVSMIPAAINHLLAQEPWARQKLGTHIGKVIWLDAGLISARLKVAGNGMVETAATDTPVDVTLRIKLADLPLLAQNRERAFSYVKVEGDADFANTVSQLSQSLRWEAEEDLSKWIGDIAATRLVAGAKTIFDTIHSTHRKTAENIAEYFLEEKPMLMRPHAVADFAGDVTRLRDEVERLAKRVDKLKGKLR